MTCSASVLGRRCRPCPWHLRSVRIAIIPVSVFVVSPMFPQKCSQGCGPKKNKVALTLAVGMGKVSWSFWFRKAFAYFYQGEAQELAETPKVHETQGNGLVNKNYFRVKDHTQAQHRIAYVFLFQLLALKLRIMACPVCVKVARFCEYDDCKLHKAFPSVSFLSEQALVLI